MKAKELMIMHLIVVSLAWGDSTDAMLGAFMRNFPHDLGGI